MLPSPNTTFPMKTNEGEEGHIEDSVGGEGKQNPSTLPPFLRWALKLEVKLARGGIARG